MALVFEARGSKLSVPEFVGLEGLGWLFPGMTILQPFLQRRRTEVVFERHIELEVVMLLFSMFAGADVEASLRRNLTILPKNEYKHKAQNRLFVAALFVKFGKFSCKGCLGQTRSEIIIL
jgi:hypothetical protein